MTAGIAGEEGGVGGPRGDGSGVTFDKGTPAGDSRGGLHRAEVGPWALNKPQEVMDRDLVFFCQFAESDFHCLAGARIVSIDFKYEVLCW